MLTLERKEGEKITITYQGEILEIYVKTAQHGKAKLSFDGPKDFQISRDDHNKTI